MSTNAEKWQLTPTFWLAGAALVVALAARVIVRKGHIAPGAVTAKALTKGAVTAPKIRKGTITGAKLASGSVTGEDLANGSVTSSKLGAGSVTSQAIASDTVTAGAIAPGSIHGESLGTETVVSKSITDLDKEPHNGEWTPSNTETAACGPDEALLGAGFGTTTQGSAQASWLQALPIINADFHGVTGRISTDDGGTATGQVVAICLK